MAGLKHQSSGQIFLIPTEQIIPNPNQPRRHFDEGELKTLSQSIRENGILQPINVRSIAPNRYEIVAGERRLRAAKQAGLDRVPCIIIRADEKKSAVYALLENLQRSDLDFFEEANAINHLIKEFHMSQDEVGRRLGRSQSALSNKLRLLGLPEDVRERISSSNLTERHARALLKLEMPSQQRKLLEIIIQRSLNVSETENLIKQLSGAPAQTKQMKKTKKLFRDVRIFVNTINHAIETMKKSGIAADTQRQETDDFIVFTVKIPKTSDPQDTLSA